MNGKLIKNHILILIWFLFLIIIGSCVKKDIAVQNNQVKKVLENTIVPSPNIISGTLPNGFRYQLFKNTEPRNRVSMHLDVQAGSMQELNNQRGVAHFLEHILFCGSTHFKPGELIKFFQKIGMQFGGDANAHTGFYETVYDVLLPNGSEKSLKEGLLVLQDYAKGALILQSEVDRERNVILAEKRDRDSSSYRTFKKSFAFLFPSTKIINRLPIGSENIIKSADSSLLKDYYNTWYRPENMVLVMVGDFNVGLAVSLIESRFSSFGPRAVERKLLKDIKIDHNGVKAFYHHETEAGNTSVSIETVESIPVEQDTVLLRKQNLLSKMANSIMQDRLELLVRKPNAKFSSASIWSGTFLRNFKMAQIDAQCSPKNWKESLTIIEQELRRALKFGFSKEELKRVKIDYLAQLDQAVKTSLTRNSQMIASQIIWSVNNEKTFLSPEQEKELLSPFIISCTLSKLHEVFKNIWSNDHRLLLVTGNVDLRNNENIAKEKILSVYKDSKKTDVVMQKKQKKAIFPYLPTPEKAGKILKRENIKNPEITVIDFQNGVRLNLKKTDFKANEVLFTLNFGKGISCEPKDKPGLAILSNKLLNESGFGKLTAVELDHALTGKNTNIFFTIGAEKFSFRGSGVSDNIQLIFQLLYTWIKDPAFRQESKQLCMERLRQQYGTYSHTIEGAMKLYVKQFLAGGDKRFGMPPLKILETYTVDDVQNWIMDPLQNAPLELSIVGDFNIDEVVKFALKYFGSLPPRAGVKRICNADIPVFPNGKSLDVNIQTNISKARVEVAWPTDDFWNIKQTRRLSVLGQLFSEKLRKRVREKLGAAYSPFCYNSPSVAYKGYGVFQAVVFVTPDYTKKILDEVKQIASRLTVNGVSNEELRQALDPILTGLKDMVKTNRYWLNSVLSGSKNAPQKIEWSRNILNDYTSITSNDLTDVARLFLNNDKAAMITISPFYRPSHK